MNGEICAAISNRCRLCFEYDGHPRVVEPYCHGHSHRGSEVVRAIQVEGGSASGRRGFGFGKLWTVAKMRNLRQIHETFVPNDPDYNPDDRAMSEIHCRI